MAEHDFNWTHGPEPDCRHCGIYGPDDGFLQPCTGDGQGLFEKVYGMDATRTNDPDDGILCFNCSEDLVRGTTEWFDKGLVLEADEIVVGATCRSCGRIWSFHEGNDGKTRSPNMWIKRPATELMGEAIRVRE